MLLLGVNIRRGATALGPVVLCFVVVVLGWTIAAVLKRWIGWSKALLILAGVVGVFYNWGALVRIPRQQSASWVPGMLVPLLAVVLVATIVVRLRSLMGFRLVALAMSSGSFIVGVPSIVDWLAGEPDPALASEAMQLSVDPAPDVVVLVLDGYGRGDVLDELYHFDNTPFFSFLESAGFTLAEGARANYSMTVASLSSAMSMAYTFPAGSSPTERGEAAMHAAIAGANSFMRSFDESGYEIVYLESGWAGSRCGVIVDTCVHSSLYDELAGVLLNRTPFYAAAAERLGHPFTCNGIRVLDQLPEVISRRAARPRLIFAHSTVPHGPLFLAADCTVDPDSARSGSKVGFGWMEQDQTAERRGYYIEQVQCVNSKVRAMVEALDDDAIVLIIGDHGPDSFGQPGLPPRQWTPDAAWERMSILTAVRAPDHCSDLLYPEITLVNTFRLVLRCLGADIGFVDDISYVYPHPPFARNDDGSFVRSARLDRFTR